MDESELLASTFCDRIPGLDRELEKVRRLTFPDPPGSTLLLSVVGEMMVREFDNIVGIDRLLSRIEEAVVQGSEGLKTAVCTGLIEALVHKSDNMPGTAQARTSKCGVCRCVDEIYDNRDDRCA